MFAIFQDELQGRVSLKRSKLIRSSLFLKSMISDFFLSCGAILNHNPIKKPAKNNKRMLIAAVFHFVDPVQEDRGKNITR